ncbi:MAG: SUMF1/EgtB/PvdO family nonheme iron enzyme [Spirochaetaceae bacterium]|jgi:formylglycine-generating enzyme required for sulfatase activity|nr:SUMF1/EgtB/PvdO family nonheme iron enzyme [Spirochaetaceae bacterium]
MKKIAVLLTVFLLLFTFNLFAQNRDLTVVAAENLGTQVNVGKQYALFIAIDAYRFWPALKKPVSDAKEIRDILKQDYFIDEIIELFDAKATRENIIRTFIELQSKLGVHDSLFIYYAGHGHYDKNSDAGFWIPADGGTDQVKQENWLTNSQIRGYISRFKAIHVFMVSDACFSGDILNTTRALPPQIDNAYYRKAYALTSRQVLTSGSSETVPDQSEFSAALINCLRKNSAPLLDPFVIYTDVRLSVKRTTPLYGTLTAASHQDGATFLFFRRQTAQPAAAAQPARTVSTTVGSITITSDIAGIIMIDGEATGTRIKAGGTVTIANVSTGATEVAVKGDDGKIVKAAQTVMVQQGQTVSAAIKASAQTPAAATQPPQTPQQPVPAAATQPQPTPTPPPASANMVRINGGTFTMGGPAAEWDRDMYVQHQVTVSSFYMGKYEVTQKEYREIMGTNPSKFKGDNLPVEMVSWFDAVEYCNKRSQKEGLTPAYTISGTGDNRTVTWNRNANGYRLPTEAEWEYACRAGTTTAYNTGATISNNTGWYYMNSNNKTHPVGQKPLNPWGLYDMHGNVLEWCWDWYGSYSSDAQTDPVGAASGSYRVLRGGSWSLGAFFARSFHRDYNDPTIQSNEYSVGVFGFRLVRP